MAEVNLYAAAKAAAGSASLSIEAADLAALITKLNSVGDLAKLLPTCSYLINGIAPTDQKQALEKSDVVDVLPQFAGG